MHIVFIRFSSLGDVVLQTSLLAWLKLTFKNCKITFVTTSSFVSLLENHPLVDEVIGYRKTRGFNDIKNLKSLAKKLELLCPDAVVDLHGTTRAKILKNFMFKTPVLTVHKRSFLRFLLVRFKLNFLAKLSSHHERVIEDFQFIFQRSYKRKKLEEFISLYRAGGEPSLTFTQTGDPKLLAAYTQDYIVISPVASFSSKRWSTQNFKRLITTFLSVKKYEAFKVILLAGPDDTYCEYFNTIEDERFENLYGKTSLEETSMYLSAAKLVVTNDTGVGHIAEACGVKVITLFGATSPDFGFRTHLVDSVSLSANMSCSPCSNTGKRKCFQASHLCMEQITLDMVFAEIQKRLPVKGEV